MPRVLGVGYDTISDILNTKMLLGALLAVMVFKSAALVISLGSGTSGGLLAPMFMASAAMGSAFAMIIDKLWPAANLSPGAFALVAMGAVFGAASRAAFTFIIFAFEITRDYNSVLPLMLVTVIADVIAVRYAKNSIMTEKLARRGLHIHQDYEPDVLQQVAGRREHVARLRTVPASMTVAELADRIGRHDPTVTIIRACSSWTMTAAGGHHHSLRPDARAGAGPSGKMTVLDASSRDLVVPILTKCSTTLRHACCEPTSAACRWWTRKDPGKPVGYLGRSSIMSARLRRLEEEYVRDPGWIGKRTAS